MSLFKREKTVEEEVDSEPKKMIIGFNPELVKRVTEKIKKIKDERSELIKENKNLNVKVSGLKEEKAVLDDKVDELGARVATAEAKCDTVEESFKMFKGDLKSSFLEEARGMLKELIRSTETSLASTNNRLMRIESDLINIKDEINDLKFMTTFNDHIQQVNLCVSIMRNADSRDHALITLLLQTIHSLVDEMRQQGLWQAGKDAVITSLLRLKSYWRTKDERIEGLVGMEINVLESIN